MNNARKNKPLEPSSAGGKNGSGQPKGQGKRRQQRRRRDNAPGDITKGLAELGISRNKLARTNKMGRALDPRGSRRRLGHTLLGSSWAVRVLHPCGEGLDAVPKIPDGSYDNSVAMERRQEISIERPSVISTPTWDVVFVAAPFLCASHFAIAYDGSTSPNQSQIQEAFYQGLCIPQSYNGWTTYTVNNGPTFQICSYPATTLDIFTNGGTYDHKGPIPSTYFRSVRRTFHGITTELDAAALSNQGRVVSAQFGPSVTPQFQSTAGTDEAWFSEVPALTLAGEVQTDLKVVQSEARFGAYLPSRMYHLPGFASNNLWYNMGVLYNSGDTAVADSNSSNIYLDGWGWSVVHYAGISASSNIRVKVREGLELTVNSASPYTPFLTPSYPDDDLAVRVVRAFFKQQAHAYPASYNALNKMIPELVRGIGSVLSILGVPYVGDLSSLLSGYLNRFT